MKAIFFPSTLLLTLTVPAGSGEVASTHDEHTLTADATLSNSTPGPEAPEPRHDPDVPTRDDLPSSELPAQLTCGIADFREKLLDRVNQARAVTRMCGRVMYPAASPVQWDARLFNAAAGHSVDMSSQNYFSHTSSDGRSVADRLDEAGYPWGTYGENLAAGQTSIEQVLEELLRSPGHCAVIMKDALTDVGVACVRERASTYQIYWSMNFGRPAEPLYGAN